MEDYDKALSVNPDFAEALVRKGIVYLLQKKYKEAVEYMEKGLSIDPSMSAGIKKYLDEAKANLK
jgi:tetratricopeptide (TPR) repeat protein